MTTTATRERETAAGTAVIDGRPGDLTITASIPQAGEAVNDHWLNEWEYSPMGPNYTEAEVGWGEDGE